MKHHFSVTVGSHKYRFEVVPLVGKYAEVDYDKFRVEIDPSVTTGRSKEFQAEVLLHEALHILLPKWTEKKVLKAGKDLARVLATAGVL